MQEQRGNYIENIKSWTLNFCFNMILYAKYVSSDLREDVDNNLKWLIHKNS